MVAISQAQHQTFVMQTQDNVNVFLVLPVFLVTCANQTIMDFLIKVAKRVNVIPTEQHSLNVIEDMENVIVGL